MRAAFRRFQVDASGIVLCFPLIVLVRLVILSQQGLVFEGEVLGFGDPDGR